MWLVKGADARGDGEAGRCAGRGSEAAKLAEPVIPDTPAGHTLVAWLDAFNSGDVARMYEFADRYNDPMRRWITDFRERTGGFETVAICRVGANQLGPRSANQCHDSIMVHELVAPAIDVRIGSNDTTDARSKSEVICSRGENLCAAEITSCLVTTSA